LRDPVLDDVLFVDGKVELEGSVSGRGTLLASREIRLEGKPKPVEFRHRPVARLPGGNRRRRDAWLHAAFAAGPAASTARRHTSMLSE
jgi:hypothetical protein